MGKAPRVDVGGLVYHAYNRGNAGGQIFVTHKDYAAFENIMEEAQNRVGIRILAYCLMPNHWHFVLYPQEDGQLATFFHWLTLTHTQRWQVVRGAVGSGHIYQGPYKSNVCEDDVHFLRLVRYVERNPLRANLVSKAEHWQWSSAWRREFGTEQHKKLLTDWPVPMPTDYQALLNEPESDLVLEEIRTCLRRGRPYGEDSWLEEMVDNYGLESTIRSRGAPKK